MLGKNIAGAEYSWGRIQLGKNIAGNYTAGEEYNWGRI